MPPSDYGSGIVGDEYGNPIFAAPMEEEPAPYVPRFTKGALDPIGQKLYDQLAQQKQLLGENASQLYKPTSFINEDEQLALMAANLARTGITDIYKVKQATAPKYLDQQYDENGQPWYVEYTGDGGSQWYPQNDPNIRFNESGAYVSKNQYINTETGQPLNVSATNVFNNDPRILSSEGTGGRTTAGFGIEFLEGGVPVYFATGYDAPRKRNFWDFVKRVLPLAVAFIPGIGQAFAPIASSILGAGASSAAVGALSQGIASAVAGTIATGDLEKGILSGITSGVLNYGGGIAKGLDDVAYVPPTSASQLAAIGTGALPGMDDLAWMDTVNPSQVAAAGIAALPEAGVSVSDITLPPSVQTSTEAISTAPTDIAANEFGWSEAGRDITDVIPATEAGAPMTPEQVSNAFKEGAISDPYIAAELATGTPMTPEQVAEAFKSGPISDPYIASDMATGGPMTPTEVADALKSGAIGDPYIANEMAGATAMGTSTTPVFDAFKSLISNPAGRFIAGQVLSGAAGGLGGAGGLLNLLGSPGATTPGGISGLAQQQAPQIYYADIPEFDVTKEFSPTLYAMREGRV